MSDNFTLGAMCLVCLVFMVSLAMHHHAKQHGSRPQQHRSPRKRD